MNDIRPKKVTHASQSTLFLIELILSVAFMALSSTVCVRLYLYAHKLSEESAFRTHAVTEVQNIFSAFCAGSSTPDDTLRYYLETVTPAEGQTPECDTSGDTIHLLYDNSWNLTNDPAAPYEIILTWKEDPDTPGMRILTARVQSTRQEQKNSAYQAECRHYRPGQHTADTGRETSK